MGIDPKEEGDRLKNVPKEFRKFIRLFRKKKKLDYHVERELDCLYPLQYSV